MHLAVIEEPPSLLADLDHLVAEKPESARRVSGPVAPAARTRLIVSVMQPAAPRGGGIAAAQPGMEQVAGAGAEPQQRVVAADLGVAEGDACLASPSTSQIVESTAMGYGPGPGPAPAQAQRLGGDPVQLAGLGPR